MGDVQIKKHYASFSEAIKDGAKLRPQIFGMFRSRNGSCALSAGAEAVLGMQCAAREVEDVMSLFPYMLTDHRPFIVCPHDDGHFMNLRDAALHLNDTHKWTREKIADWLYAEEEKLGFVTLVETEPHDEPISELKYVESRSQRL